MKHSILALVVLGCVSAVRADVFLLADGARVEGTAVESGDSLIITAFDGHTLTVPLKSVRGSVPEPKKDAYFARLKALKSDDVPGRIELAKFCVANHFKPEAEALYRAALKLDPKNETAGTALGLELRGGKWLPKDESFVIGERPPVTPKNVPTPLKAKPALPELPKDPQQAWRVRLMRISVDGALPRPPEPEVDALVAEAQDNPAYLLKLLIPPQFPNALAQIPPEVRGRGAWIAGYTRDRRFMDALVTASVYDSDENVRLAAAKALPLLDEPVAIRKLTDIAFSGDLRVSPWPVRQRASVALRRYGSQEVIERLMKELSFELAGGNPVDPKNHLRGKGQGLGSDNPIGAPTDSGLAYGAPDTDLYPVLSAAKEITGQSFDKKEKDLKTWIAWWKKDGMTFNFKD